MRVKSAKDTLSRHVAKVAVKYQLRVSSAVPNERVMARINQ